MKKFLKFIFFLMVIAIISSALSNCESEDVETNYDQDYDFTIQTNSEYAEGTGNQDDQGLPELATLYGEPLVEFPDESLLWGYTQLTAEEQAVYHKLRDGAAAHFSLPIDLDISYESLERALDALNYDHPEIFWFDGELTYYTDSDTGTVTTVELAYNTPLEEVERLQLQVESYIAGCMASEAMVTAQSDFDRVLAVYRYLVDHTEYDINYREDQSVVSLMQEGRAVCRGYAESFCLIMHRLGIPCTIIEGLSSQDWVLSVDGHAWNAVMLNGQWYNIDATWGDPLWEEGSDTTTPADDYILVNDELFDRDHTDFSKIGSPQCTSMELNYHGVYGLLHSVWSEEYFRWAVQAQLNYGLPWAQVRYDNYEAYYQAKSALIDGDTLGDIVMDLGFGKKEGNYTSWSYNYDDTTGVIAVKLIY